MNALNRLAALGTSVWVDGLVPPVELERLVRRDSVTGLTSNPTIFRAAVLDGERYAERIAACAGAPPQTLYEALAIEDVQAAADVLASVFAGTNGADGFVSLEVAPELAHDADATVEAARDLWARVDRPNAMIKIPATPAGVDAIRRSVAHGINVNVTLLFALDAHNAVIEAYIAALEERARRGRSVSNVASVGASSCHEWTPPSTSCSARVGEPSSPVAPPSPTPAWRTRTPSASSPAIASRR